MDNGEKLRLAQLVEHDPEAFFAVAVSVLRNRDDEDACGHVIRLLISSDQLIAFLQSHSELTPVELTAIFRTALKLLPSADLKLSRYICDNAYHLGRETILRLLDLLEQTTHSARVSPVIVKLLAHGDPVVRSKAARLINLSSDERSWAAAEADPRVLANAVEALWHVDDSPVRASRYWRASKSPYPRVAGNALVGLYRSGVRDAITLLSRMAEHDSAAFRRTAAWAMGETGDPEFVPLLSRMLGEEQGAIRANVLRSLARIRRRAIEHPQRPMRGVTGS